MAEKEIICQRVTVANASKELGIDQDTLRFMMQKKVIDIGQVIPPKTKGGRYEYLIFRAKLDKFLGLRD